MNNRFTIDQLSKSETIDPNSINRLYKINTMLDFMEIRSNNRGMTQKQICNQLGFSDSTIKRYRDDIKMNSPYNRNNYKNNKPKKSLDTKTENISKNNKTDIDEIAKNDMKGGNTSNNHTISTKEIIDYAFQNDITNQKDNHMSGKELIERAFNTTINE